MPGSMRKRGDSWEMRVYAGTDPETGKRQWRSATTKGTRRAAQRALVEFAARVDYPRRMTCSGDRRQSSRRLVRGAVTELVTDDDTPDEERYRLPPHTSSRTPEGGHSAHRGHRRPLWRSTPSGGKYGQPFSPGTVHRIHVVLHRALAQALRWEWIWVNPASTASPPSCERAPIYPPSPEEVVRLLSHVAGVDPDFHTFLTLAVSTGARRSQLGALRWGDVDLERGQIGFLRALLDAKGGPVVRPTKTGRTYRVNLDADSLEILVGHHSRMTERAQRSGVDIDRSSFVFSMILWARLRGHRIGSPNNSSPIAE